MTPTEAAFLLWHHSLASAAKRAEIEGLGAVQIIVAGLANEGAGVAVKAACLGLLRSLAKDDNACQTLATMKIDKFSAQPMPLCLVLEFLDSSEAAQEAALETFRELAVRSGPKAVLMKKAADIPWRRLVNLLPNLSPKLCATLCGTLRALTAGKPDLRAKLVALGAVGRLCKIMGGGTGGPAPGGPGGPAVQAPRGRAAAGGPARAGPRRHAAGSVEDDDDPPGRPAGGRGV